MRNVKYTALAINKKDFPVEYKGYKAEEVDAFLDDIVADYKIYEETVDKLSKQIQELKDELARTNEQADQIVRDLNLSQAQLDSLIKSGNNSSALIKRVAEMERKLADFEK